ncbi:hypothetical protein JVU11DRAFT_7846 [Chiua virens]|nr:hypothetical protein JVU11DRAFT_7846 [Chiua virens]
MNHAQARTTLAQLLIIKSKADPLDIKVFFHEVQRFHLNSISEPFWIDYLLVCPSHFLIPELLYHLHKLFWDHDIKWCINVLGVDEIIYTFQSCSL